MESASFSVLLMIAASALIPLAMLAAGTLLGPRRAGSVKGMPYESDMDPIHDARRRFDVRFHLVAVAFIIFDVELLFLDPWAVASGHPQGVDKAVEAGLISGRGIVFGSVMFFLFFVVLGLVYEWRRGVLRWRWACRTIPIWRRTLICQAAIICQTTL